MVDLQGCIILLLVWLASIVLFRAIFSKTQNKFRLPPSPLALPIIGHLHLLGPIPHQALHKLSNHYGPLIHLQFGSVPSVVASSEEIAKEFLKGQEFLFSNRPLLTVVDCLSYPSSDFIFAPFGDYWKFMKKLCMSQLLGGRTLDQLLPVRREEIRRLLNLMQEKANAREQVDVGGELTKATSNIVWRMSMSQRCAENDNEADEIRFIVKESTEILGKFNLSDHIWFLKKFDLQGLRKKSMEIHEKFDDMMERIIKEHDEARKEGKGRGDIKDFLDILLEISEDESSEIRLSRENIKAFILVLF